MLNSKSVDQLLYALSTFKQLYDTGISVKDAYQMAISKTSVHFGLFYQTIGDLLRRRLLLDTIADTEKLFNQWMDGNATPLLDVIIKNVHKMEVNRIKLFFKPGGQSPDRERNHFEGNTSQYILTFPKKSSVMINSISEGDNLKPIDWMEKNLIKLVESETKNWLKEKFLPSPYNTPHIIQKIRDFINNPRIQDQLRRDDNLWNTLWSCLDSIEDSDSAISSYLKFEFQNGEHPAYLAVYGLLQSLIVQQDSTLNICGLFKYSPEKEKYPDLKYIRRIRNLAVGHPTDAKNGKVHSTISMSSLSSSGFELITIDDKGNHIFENVDTEKIIRDQAKNIYQILMGLINHLEDTDKEERSKFKSESLGIILEANTNYYFQKVYESLLENNSHGPEYGIANTKAIDNILIKFRNLLKKRGIGITTYPSLNKAYTDIIYSMNEIDVYLNKQKEGLDPSQRRKTILIICEHAKSNLDKLKDLALEIDTEYLSD